MPNAPHVRSLVLILVLCAMASVPVFAQMETATLSGAVTDPNGRVVPDVEVTATRIETGTVVTTKTNGAGIYFFTGLLPGHYHLLIHKPGFKEIAIKEFELHVQDKLEQNFSLEIGSVSETVTVTAETSMINTIDASVGTVIDRNFVENIPLNGRSFQDLISMTPGVVTNGPNSSSGLGTGGDFAVNGQRTESNIYMVDGVSANVGPGSGLGSTGNSAVSGSVPAGTVLGTTQSLISVDALEEFRVQSSTYSAELGRSPGGQFSLVTRSGTNDFHGTVYDYFRNDFFDANDWFNDSLKQPKSALRQNDFGGTLGGPIWKDRTFFFVSYEGLRLTQPQAASSNNLVPDTFMRQQAPAALQPILNAFPVQNGQDFGSASAPSLAEFIKSFSLPSSIDSASVRLDHSFAPQLSVFFRFGYTPSSASSRGGDGGESALSQTSVNLQTYTLGAVSQLSNRAHNDFRLNYSRSEAKTTSALDNFGGATPINLAAAMGASAGAGPEMIIEFPGVGISFLREVPGSNRLRQWNLVDTFSIVTGHHQFKIGADYRRIVSPAKPSSPGIVPIYLSPQEVLSNQALISSVGTFLSATPVFNESAAFVQDEWRVAPRLNLSLGLRWEVDPAPHGANGQDAFTLLGSISEPSSLALAPRGTPLWHTTWYNFAPRLGVAWTVRNDPAWETVVRGGGGVYFDTNNQVAGFGFSGVGFLADAFYPNAPLPLTPTQLNISPSVSCSNASPCNSVYAFPAHLQLPYTLEWNAAVQQSLGSKQAITLTYVGHAARRMSGQLSLQGINALNPNFGSINYFTTGLTSDYHALQAQFQRNVSHGIHALASYTWSHCLDDGSYYTSLAYAPGLGTSSFLRGNCDIDVRQNLQGGVSWDLPGVTRSKLLQALVNNWGLDGRLIARTAFPVPLCGSQIIDPATGNEHCAGLDLVPNTPLYIYGSEFPGGRSINPGAFCDPTLGPCPGSAAPRNFVRGFGEWQINLAVRREFPINERLRLQFRAEAFNVVNHPNFGYVDPNLSDTTFGQALFMLNQSLTTVQSQYQQGGPRSMQFALKVLF